MKKTALLALLALSALLASNAGSAVAEEGKSLTDRLYDDYGIEMLGFAETRWGVRLVDDENEDTLSIGEARAQLELTRFFDSFTLQFKGDLLADAVTEELDADIRGLNVAFRPSDVLDVKIGRMVSTWGTGDLVFINDMFPKDWQSFFTGRDDEYLKQASNSLRIGFFLGEYTIDVVYTPRFQGSEFVTGERLSYFHPGAGQIVGQNMIMADDKPNEYFKDDETSVRHA